jgi:hypothetical protein
MTLPQLAHIDDYADEAEVRPISQYQDKPRLRALILSYVNRCQELENAAWDVILKRMIDNAENAQLDTIGKIVGQQRRTGQSDAVYRIYITARIRINRSQGHADDVIDVLQLVEAGALTWTEYYPAGALIEYAAPTATDPTILAELARLAVAAGVRLDITAGLEVDGFLLGDDDAATTVDVTHGLADDGETVGGFLSGAY